MQRHAGQREGCDTRSAKSQGTNGFCIEREPGIKELNVRISGRPYHTKDPDRITTRKTGTVDP